jgi:WD40 repeat protein
MSKRPIRGESPSTAHKRQAAAPQDEEPLPTASASLAQQASSLSMPKMPLDLIADLILPFVADRATWNNVCSASNDLRLAAKKMTPPWPNKAFNMLEHPDPVCHVSFSPSGSQLAFSTNNHNTGQFVVHVWDPWGKETLLGGHTGKTFCLEYSLDGEYLASGIVDGSIHIWRAESCHATFSQHLVERGTRTPKQADAILVARRSVYIATLSFSRTDSNLLASGGSQGEIKVWNVKEQACIHSFNPGRGPIRSLFFAGGADIACIAAAHTGSIIRLWRAEGSSDFASETMGEANLEGWSLRDAVFSPSGSFVATSFCSNTRHDSTLALYELETVTKTQTVAMPGFTACCVAVSPDDKQLVVVCSRGRIRLLQTNDLGIQRDMDTTGEAKTVCSVAFDPTCRVLAFGHHDGSLELRSL